MAANKHFPQENHQNNSFFCFWPNLCIASVSPCFPHATMKQEYLIGLNVANSPYRIIEFMAKGSFGLVYRGKHRRTNADVAIKTEPEYVPRRTLALEYHFYQKLTDRCCLRIPKFFAYDRVGDGTQALVLELLGPNLLEVRRLFDSHRFSITTTMQLTIQLLEILNQLSNAGIIYRDIKPENFLLGMPNSYKWCYCHVVDLGLSKMFIDQTGRHILPESKQTPMGTKRYSSINNHKGLRTSRRDDLEALGYMMVFLYKDNLPWKELDSETYQSLYGNIQVDYRRRKEAIDEKDLCRNMPEEFVKLLKDAKSLRFAEEPEYRQLIDLFHSRLNHDYGLDYEWQIYDWTNMHMAKEDADRYL